MSVANGKISPRMGTKLGVNGDGDLQLVFGSSVMNHEWYFLSAPINKWARYKPFRHPNGASYNDHYTGPNEEYIVSDRLNAAASVNFGLSAPSAIANNPAGTLGQVWNYNRCQSGDELSAFDFECYNHNAGAPVASPGDITISLSTTSSFSFGGYISHQQSGTDTIAWADLPAVGSYYLCVVFSTGANCTGTLIAKTSAETLGSGSLSLDITQNELSFLQSNGYKYYYLVGRSVQLTTLSDPGTNSAYYLGLPAPSSTYDLAGEFNIIAAAVASAVITHYSIDISPSFASRFVSASPYIGPESFPATQSDYLKQATAPYWLHLAFDVTAGASNLTILNPRIALSQTFNSANGFSSPVTCTLRDSNYAAVSQVVIPAGQTQRIYLIASTAILGLYQNGTQGGQAIDQYFGTTVKLYNGNVLIDETNILRVRNYDF